MVTIRAPIDDDDDGDDGGDEQNVVITQHINRVTRHTHYIHWDSNEGAAAGAA